MTSTERVVQRPRRSTRTTSGFRPDIEGLRAIAVLSVIVYHLRSDWLPGGFIGVDIFFVISGFLITSHLVREHEKTGRISLARFYARRMVRLIPAATVVLLGTVVATALFVPRVLWQQIGTDIVASATYVINWVLAFRSVDYLAEDSVVSPVQHFWSLAVEEQFYLIWPLLILIAGATAVRFGLPKRRVMAVGGIAIIVVSLAAAVFSEVQGDVTGYFSTFTRLWELAAGGLAALAIGRLRRVAPLPLLGVIFVIGLVIVIGSVALVALPRYWPGALTLLPVLGTAMVLISGGAAESRGFAERALSIRPLTWTGGISYSLYLWHWPIIVIAGYVFTSIGLVQSAAIVALSVALAWLSSLLVENPIRFSGWATKAPRNGLILGLTCALITVAAGVGLGLAAPGTALRAPEGAVPAGATALTKPVDSTPASVLTTEPQWILPSALDAPKDLPELYADGCQQDRASADVKQCTYGDTASDRVMALVGDSKAAQWQPALETIANRLSMRLVIMTKSACAFSTAPSTLPDGGRYTSCEEWNDAVVDQLVSLDPELVVTSQVQGTAWNDDGATDAAEQTAMADGVATRLSRIADGDTDVAIISDTPQTPQPISECVAEHPDDVFACGFPLAKGIQDSALPTQLLAAEALGATVVDDSGVVTPGSSGTVALVDVTDLVCPPQSTASCPPIIGNALIYRQGSHLTATYVESMTDSLQSMLSVAGVVPAS